MNIIISKYQINNNKVIDMKLIVIIYLSIIEKTHFTKHWWAESILPLFFL